MDESVIPYTSQYYVYSRGIIGVIVHCHVINLYILIFILQKGDPSDINTVSATGTDIYTVCCTLQWSWHGENYI